MPKKRDLYSVRMNYHKLVLNAGVTPIYPNTTKTYLKTVEHDGFKYKKKEMLALDVCLVMRRYLYVHSV